MFRKMLLHKKYLGFVKNKFDRIIFYQTFHHPLKATAGNGFSVIQKNELAEIIFQNIFSPKNIFEFM